MKNKISRVLTFLTVFLFLFTSLGQVAYAAKKPPPVSEPKLTLNTSYFEKTVPLGESWEFSVTVTYTGTEPLTWTPSADLSEPYGFTQNVRRSTSTYKFKFTAAAAGSFPVSVIISGSGKTVEFKADFIVPGIPPPIEPLKYVALGDSIPYGTYYSSLWDYLNGGTDTSSYVEQLAAYLEILPENFTDASVSGFNAFEVYAQMPSLETKIAQADIITLSVGGNDIMDAAARSLSGLDKHDLDFAAADAGRDSFQYYWPRIIDRIETLNPDVRLLVMTVYNPYHTDDSYAGVNYFELVDPYFSQDTGSDPGLNHLIKSMMSLDNSGVYWSADLISDTFDYRVADIYGAFNSYGDGYDDKDALTGFYRSFCDPHPNQLGQNLIFSRHQTLLGSFN